MQAVSDEVEPYWPAAHETQAEPRLKDPAAQGEQPVDEEEAPVTVPEAPSGQLMQAARNGVGPYRPAGHETQPVPEL